MGVSSFQNRWRLHDVRLSSLEEIRYWPRGLNVGALSREEEREDEEGILAWRCCKISAMGRRADSTRSNG